MDTPRTFSGLYCQTIDLILSTPSCSILSSHYLFLAQWYVFIGTGKRGHSKGVFSLKESLEALAYLDYLRSLGDGRFSCFPPWSCFLSRTSEKWTFLKKPFFQKTPFSDPDEYTPEVSPQKVGCANELCCVCSC